LGKKIKKLGRRKKHLERNSNSNLKIFEKEKKIKKNICNKIKIILILKSNNKQ